MTKRFHDVGEYGHSLIMQGGDAAKWGERIRELVTTEADHVELCEDIDRALEKTGAMDRPDVDTYQAGLAAVMEEYEKARTFADGVFTVLVGLGALADDEDADDGYMLALLGALLPPTEGKSA